MAPHSEVFVSWSGKQGKMLTEALKEWLPLVVDAPPIWVSSLDLPGGTRWSQQIAVRLEKCDLGILVVAPGNSRAPWLLFEAGAP